MNLKGAESSTEKVKNVCVCVSEMWFRDVFFIFFFDVEDEWFRTILLSNLNLI